MHIGEPALVQATADMGLFQRLRGTEAAFAASVLTSDPGGLRIDD
jgi:hypothetical protein